MTKKHYVQIAAEINDRMKGAKGLKNEEAIRVGIRATVEALISVMQRDNPRFDRVRFLKACGLEE